MKTFLQKTLMAYRPMYLNGLLLDGQYRLPMTDLTDSPADPADSKHPTRSRQRTLLAALIPSTHQHRNKP